MTLDLSSSVEKVERAFTHLKALEAESRAMAKRADKKLALAEREKHRDGLGYTFRVTTLVAPRPRFSLILGDLLHNLRSALDHLAWQLVIDGSDPDPSNPNFVQFPVYSTGRSRSKKKRTFCSEIDKRLPGVGKAERAIIDGYQPYHRAQRPHPLAMLVALSNIDKHRNINPIYQSATEIDPHTVVPVGGELTEVRIRLKPGDRVQKGTPILDARVDRPETQVEMYSDITTTIAFENGTPLMAMVREMSRDVIDVLGDFEWRWGSIAHLGQLVELSQLFAI